MANPTAEPMTAAERRAGLSLSGIFALRMLGLFLILPVFAIHAHNYNGGDNLAWVGITLGAYGLTQAVFQMPLGILSDRIGRKRVIIAGLLCFAAGSVVAALATDIRWVAIARALQGAGAISAAVTALAADLTRDTHRTRIMAMIGSSIALVFALSMVIAPPLHARIGLSGLFWITAVLALAAIYVIVKIVPDAPVQTRSPAAATHWRAIWRNGQLMRLNLGIFALHLIQTTMWVLVPFALLTSGKLPSSAHWKVYLPAVLLSFAIMVPAIIAAEVRQQLKKALLLSITALIVVQIGFYSGGGSLWSLALWLTLFFSAFNILEAILPSWISRIAPADVKGLALGLYNTLQSCGLFLGGLLGGVLAEHFGNASVHLVCALVAVLWLLLAFGLRAPQQQSTP